MKQTHWKEKGFTLLSLLCLLALVPACTVGPDYSMPDISKVMQDTWQAGAAGQDRFDTGRQPDSEWWQQFHDKTLNNLIKRLKSSNLALIRARERIVEAAARQGIVGADKQLQLAAALGYTRGKTGDEAVSLQGLPPGKTLDVFSTGVTAGWELDLWGRTARLLEAGEADIRAGYADYHGQMVSLAAGLTLAYVEARTLEARLAKVKENINLQQKTLELARSGLEAGNGTKLAVMRTRRLLSSTRSRLPELERSLAVARNRIHVLLGLPPGKPVLSPGPLPGVPMMIGTGLPADLVTRRPDIRLALHRYHSAVARIGAAEAEKYPTLSLSGMLTLSSDTAGGILDMDSLIYTLGPGLRFPILTGNRIESTVAVRKSQAEQARLGLEQQIVTALAEAESAAIGVVRSQQRTLELENAEKFAQKSVQLADELYQAGLGDLFQVLDNQQQLVSIQESLLLARQQALSQVVFLYRALGGGWQSTMVQHPVQTQKN